MQQVLEDLQNPVWFKIRRFKALSLASGINYPLIHNDAKLDACTLIKTPVNFLRCCECFGPPPNHMLRCPKLRIIVKPLVAFTAKDNKVRRKGFVLRVGRTLEDVRLVVSPSSANPANLGLLRFDAC